MREKTELLIKSRESILAAIQIYNNPLINFKYEYSLLTLITEFSWKSLNTYNKRSNTQERKIIIKWRENAKKDRNRLLTILYKKQNLIGV